MGRQHSIEDLCNVLVPAWIPLLSILNHKPHILKKIELSKDNIFAGGLILCSDYREPWMHAIY